MAKVDDDKDEATAAASGDTSPSAKQHCSSDRPADAIPDPGQKPKLTLHLKKGPKTRRLSGSRPADDSGCRQAVASLRRVILAVDRAAKRSSMEDEKVTMLDYDSLMNATYDLAMGEWGVEVKDKDGDTASSALSGTDAAVSRLRVQHPQALGQILDLGISPGGNDLIESVHLMRSAQALGSVLLSSATSLAIKWSIIF